MWKKLKSQQGFLYMILITESGYKFYLTDLGQIWSEEATSDVMAARCKELNPRAQVPLQKLFELVETFPQVSVHEDVTKEGCDYLLNMKRLIGGLPFNWSYHLTLQSPEEFKQLVMMPLIRAATVASSNIDDLVAIIYKKDKEIDDYKSSGARVSRRHLETVPFSKEHFLIQQNMKVIEDSITKDPLQLFCSMTGNIVSSIVNTDNNVHDPAENKAAEDGTEARDSETSRDGLTEILEVSQTVTQDTTRREKKKRDPAVAKPKPAVKKKKLKI